MKNSSEPLDLEKVNRGDKITYLASNVLYFDYSVFDVDEDRSLPYVEITARPARGNCVIVEKLNRTAMRGIMLGSSDDFAEDIDQGVLLPGKMVAVEMVIEDEIVFSLFPAPESRPILQRSA